MVCTLMVVGCLAQWATTHSGNPAQSHRQLLRGWPCYDIILCSAGKPPEGCTRAWILIEHLPAACVLGVPFLMKLSCD